MFASMDSPQCKAVMEDKRMSKLDAGQPAADETSF